MEPYEEWLKREGFGILGDDQIFEILHELREGDPIDARNMLENALMAKYLVWPAPVVTFNG